MEKGSHEITRGLFDARGRGLELADKQIGELKKALRIALTALEAAYGPDFDSVRAVRRALAGLPVSESES